MWGENAKREFDEGEAIKIQNPRIDLYNDQLTLNIAESTAIVKPSDEELMNLPSFDELKEAIDKFHTEDIVIKTFDDKAFDKVSSKDGRILK